MSKSNKIIVIAISVTLALCVTVIAFSSATDTEKPTSVINTENQPSVTASESAYDETVPTAEPSADVNGTTAQQTPSGGTPESSESLTSSSALGLHNIHSICHNFHVKFFSYLRERY